MTVLPIVERELVVAARRSATYWTRFWVAAVALSSFIFLRISYTGSMAIMGHQLFNVLGVATLAFALLSGVFITADSLSEEKREGTLGLLFLTDLKGYDVVLGKLAANSLHAFFGLLAVFPVLALPLLVGGVSGAEFWRTMLVFVCALYFSLSVGMLISATSQEGRQAMAGTFGIILAIAGILPVLWELQSHTFHKTSLDFLLLLPNPAYAYSMGFDLDYHARFGAQQFWRSMGVITSLATACIVAASLLLPRLWQHTPSSSATGKRRFLKFWPFASRARRRPALQETSPFYWLAMSDRSGQSALNRTVILLLLVWFACVLAWRSNHNGVFDPITVFYVFGVHLTAKVLMAAESSRRFHQDRQSGALELLMVTPLPLKDIVAGQKNALKEQFRFSVLLLCLINLLTLQFMLKWDSGLSNPNQNLERNTFIEIFLGGAVVLWLDAAALRWVGMWRGLKARKHSRAVLATLAQVTGIPWLAFSLFIALSFISSNLFNEDHFYIYFALWFLVGAVIDIVSILGARRKLNAEFRSTVAQRYGG
jgi:ABC-type transport system involved in cytochrome c biogenesis permease component